MNMTIRRKFKTSISRFKDCLVITVEDEMDDLDLQAFSEYASEVTVGKVLKGCVLDFSQVSIVDDYAFTIYLKITRTMKLLGLNVVWSGLKPEVVVALMDSEISVNETGISYALTMERGINLLLGETL